MTKPRLYYGQELSPTRYQLLKSMTEDQHQEEVFRWAESNRHLYVVGGKRVLDYLYHVPNGARMPWRKNTKGQRYSPEAQRMKRLGLKSGAPDLRLDMLGSQPLIIEMKRLGEKPTPEQIDWLKHYQSLGYDVAVCEGYPIAIMVLKSYLNKTQGQEADLWGMVQSPIK